MRLATQILVSFKLRSRISLTYESSSSFSLFTLTVIETLKSLVVRKMMTADTQVKRQIHSCKN